MNAKNINIVINPWIFSIFLWPTTGGETSICVHLHIGERSSGQGHHQSGHGQHWIFWGHSGHTQSKFFGGLCFLCGFFCFPCFCFFPCFFFTQHKSFCGYFLLYFVIFYFWQFFLLYFKNCFCFFVFLTQLSSLRRCRSFIFRWNHSTFFAEFLHILISIFLLPYSAICFVSEKFRNFAFFFFWFHQSSISPSLEVSFLKLL